MCSHSPLLCTVSQLNLSENHLCGLDNYGRGIYNAEGIKAIADALRVAGSLTVLILSRNKIEDEGAIAIGHALRDNADCKMQALELVGCGIGAGGAKALAAFCAVSASLTKLDARWNYLGHEGEAVLRKAVEGRAGFELML